MSASGPPSSDAPRISVIVPVRDDVAGIRKLLECLERQTVGPDQFEVVIGDDGSDQAPVEAIESPDLRVRVVHGEPMTSYAARNRAAAAARGSILAFCDSDCRPEPKWLEEGVSKLAEADLVAGEVAFAAGRRSVWSLLMVDMFLDQSQNVSLSRAVTANLLTTRQLFAAAGGFDESLPSGGDYDFTRRCVGLGARLIHAPHAIVRHPTLPAAKPFLRKVWWTNRWLGARTARSGRRPQVAEALEFTPLFGPMLARRRAHRPIGRLQRNRIAQSGLTMRRRDELLALAVLYLVVAPTAFTGRAQGLLEGRRASMPPARYAADLHDQPGQ